MSHEGKKILPSNLLRKWRRAGKMLNVAHALGKIHMNKRFFNGSHNQIILNIFNFRSCSDPDLLNKKDNDSEEDIPTETVVNNCIEN